MAAEQIQDSKANIKVEKQPNGQVRLVARFTQSEG